MPACSACPSLIAAVFQHPSVAPLTCSTRSSPSKWACSCLSDSALLFTSACRQEHRQGITNEGEQAPSSHAERAYL
eukprot:1161177-Pelagomonas_calceolata.AAC.5